jgi:hypothetical protein
VMTMRWRTISSDRRKAARLALESRNMRKPARLVAEVAAATKRQFVSASGSAILTLPGFPSSISPPPRVISWQLHDRVIGSGGFGYQP